MQMQIITVISRSCDTARRNFSRGEQSMLIDIFNGTILTPGILGRHLTAQVEDSFTLYPGVYEGKWGVSRDEMMKKIDSLSPLDAIFLELWAVGFWALNTSDAGEFPDYLSGKLNFASRIEDIARQLDTVCGRLEKTRSSFKSAAVAEARQEIEQAVVDLRSLI